MGAINWFAQWGIDMTTKTLILLAATASLLTLSTPGITQDHNMASAPVADQAPAPTLPSLSMGQTVTGEIAPPMGGCVDNPRIRSYRFTAAANSRVEITMTAENFDTVLEVGRQTGCEFTSLGVNDDGAGPEDGLNSRLTLRIREAGDYVVRAQSLGEDGTGSFNLTVNQLPPPATDPAPIAMTIGRRVRGTLTTADATISNGVDESLVESSRPYHMYALTGEAGQVVRLSLDSNEFDPVVEVGAQSPLGYSVAAYNDDGGGPQDGLNSRLNVTFRTAGTVIVRVSPLGNDVGRYTLQADIVTADTPAVGQ
jgi:hypothetical protein